MWPIIVNYKSFIINNSIPPPSFFFFFGDKNFYLSICCQEYDLCIFCSVLCEKRKPMWSFMVRVLISVLDLHSHEVVPTFYSISQWDCTSLYCCHQCVFLAHIHYPYFSHLFVHINGWFCIACLCAWISFHDMWNLGFSMYAHNMSEFSLYVSDFMWYF